MIEGIKNYIERAWQFGQTHSPAKGQGALNTVLSLVIAGIGLVIGVYVFSEIEGNMDIVEGSHVDNIVSDLFLSSPLLEGGKRSLWNGTNSVTRVSGGSHTRVESLHGGEHCRPNTVPLVP